MVKRTGVKKYRLLINTVGAVLATSLAVISQAKAGWSSGGGEIVQDSQNPWFVKNKTEVTACIDIDEDNLGATKEQTQQHIEDAWEYWGKQFSEKDKELGVAAQKLSILPECTANVDIRFQMGKLTPEQKAGIPDLGRFIAMSVRTDYDRLNMIGKGFVYVAPQSGELKPNDRNIAKNRWELESGVLLKLAIMHELGHVFGLSHNNFTGFDLMGAEILEIFLTW
jgi:hypothetical protein